MTQGTIETKGTRLYFAPGESEILRVSCMTGIQGLGGPGNQIDQTCLDSEEMEYKRGMKDPQAITIPFNVIPRSAAQQALVDLDESGIIIPWMVVLSDQSDSPSEIDSEGLLVSPGGTSVGFRGYVADVTFDIQVNEMVRGTLTVQRSGQRYWTWPAADLA